ncbi:MAG: sigma-54-dependent Fis family transcriptional regulator [Deltaproteobacteria bacterium]|nr:sigma-54-dependent Fis family transcriptional regulator [Deltaproteobacteria bacterium]
MNSKAIRVLVAEDDPGMLDLVGRVLLDEGYEVISARNGDEAWAKLESDRFDLVVSDIRMQGCDGMELLHRAMAKRLHQPVILMTAFGSIASAVEAMRQGAHYYLAKPFDIEDLIEIVGSAASRVREHEAIQAPEVSDPFFPVVFKSESMGRLLRMAHEVAASQATVLITGRSGTGKELLARAIHGMSQRKAAPFVAVDCNAIPETLLESELFGHKRGAFTGAVSDKQGIIEQAAEGTLLLDEVGNLSPQIQSKLLRFLQERQFRRVGDPVERSVNVRVISATNCDLNELVRQGRFRDDLFYRLSVIPLKIPDLSERREDIAPLVYHFIRRFNTEYRVEGIRSDALDMLIDFDWPGNVRQLENVVERAVILRKGGLIQPRDLPEEISGSERKARGGRSLEEMERQYVQQLLAECGGNQSRVARILGINRRTLYRKLRKIDSDPGSAS